MDQNILEELFKTIQNRKDADPESSYVASLYAKGTEKITQKVGEEAIETCIEAIKGNADKVKEESADLLFHLMVMWANADITPKDVLNVLEKRMGTSGHEEKANRSK